MGVSVYFGDDTALDFSWNEVTGAIGDSVTVLPIVVAVAVLSDLSLAVMLLWFGAFQIVWGLHYGVPVSVEPMKALAALIIAGTITTGEFLLAGLLLGVVLLAIGATGSLERVEQHVGSPVVRGIQLGVALVLLETGLRLGAGDLRLAALAAGVALVPIALGSRNLSALAVLVAGAGVAALSTGVPSPSLPAPGGPLLFGVGDLTLPALEAAVGQLAMTVGNAALATSVLLGDYFDRDISADELSASMGAMNLLAVPLGGLPMCHGSGGVAGKYAFGARTAAANVVLGIGYAAVAVLGVGLVAAYPVSMLGVILALVALQLGRTSLRRAEHYPVVIAVAVCGLVVNLGAAFVLGAVADALRRWIGSPA
ncbi:MAG: putative sulfate/molybdate transporter [Haloferacaceae archaeon]